MEVSLQNNYSAIVNDFQKPPEWVPHKLQELEADQILIQIQASTINPSDILSITGLYRGGGSLPLLGGKEGVGRIIKAGANVQQYKGKRVCFCHQHGGAWSHYAISNPKTNLVFVIDDDVPVSSAASGIVNPLTVLGFIHEVKRRKQTSIIHTAAASALGRMLSKICKSEGITLLNVVRRQQQADLLKNEGAEHVIVTTGDWEEQYAKKVKELKSKVLFDALGGGQVQTKLIQRHPTDGVILVYGLLEGKTPQNPTIIPAASLISGLQVTGFILGRWYPTIKQEEREEIRSNYSTYLKNQLSSTFSKEYKFEQIVEALEYYKENATKGKLLLRP